MYIYSIHTYKHSLHTIIYQNLMKQEDKEGKRTKIIFEVDKSK